MTYMTPVSLDDALAALAERAPSIIAGGTDWYPAQGEREITCDMLDVTRIKELRGIDKSDQGWRIGGATTWSDIAKADLPHMFDVLKAAAREVGSIQIQNAGTIAGNLCNASSAADGVPPLLTLNARIELRSSQGARILPLSEFIQGVRKVALKPNELMTAVLIPETAQAHQSAFVKLGAREYLVISIAMVAVSLVAQNGRLHDLRIAVGACSPVAQRLAALEAALEGQSITEVDAITKVCDLSPLSPIDDVRGTGGFRLDVVRPLIARALREAAHV